MRIIKFGGAPLRTLEGFHQMVAVLASAQECVVVVSALANTTRRLIEVCNKASSGDLESALQTIDEIAQLHISVIEKTISSQRKPLLLGQLQDAVRLLIRITTSIHVTKHCTARTRDRVMAFGEQFSLLVITGLLVDKGLDVATCPARDLIVTTSDFGMSLPIAEKTRVRVERILSPLLQNHNIVITEGFVGANESGDVTTMGAESSNLTATLLGSMLEAENITIYTDVEGVRSADPALVTNTELRPAFSYSEARLAAKHGLKLFYPTMIEPAEKANIPITFASVFHPDGDTTTVSSEASSSKPMITVHRSGQNETVDVSVVFCNVAQWTRWLVSQSSEIHDFNSIAVVGNPADQCVTLTCTEHQSSVLVQQLHASIIETQ